MDITTITEEIVSFLDHEIIGRSFSGRADVNETIRNMLYQRGRSLGLTARDMKHSGEFIYDSSWSAINNEGTFSHLEMACEVELGTNDYYDDFKKLLVGIANLKVFIFRTPYQDQCAFKVLRLIRKIRKSPMHDNSHWLIVAMEEAYSYMQPVLYSKITDSATIWCEPLALGHFEYCLNYEFEGNAGFGDATTRLTFCHEIQRRGLSGIILSRREAR